MTRQPRKKPIKSKPFPLLGKEVELVVWRDMNDQQFTISLEDWQVWAIQQVLGMYADGDDIHYFSQSDVGARVKKMGELSLVIKEERE